MGVIQNLQLPSLLQNQGEERRNITLHLNDVEFQQSVSHRSQSCSMNVVMNAYIVYFPLGKSRQQ